MQITADINTDDIVQEIMDSSELDRHINDVVDNLVNDQVEEHIGRLDIDDINDFERRVEEIVGDTAHDIVRDAVSEAMRDVADPQDSEDRIAELERKVEHLTDALSSVISILSLAGKVVTPSI